MLTTDLLGLITSHSTCDGVVFSGNAVRSALDVGLRLRSFDLSFAAEMFLLSRLSPGIGAGSVTDGLDDVPLYRVVLAGSLARETSTR